MKSVSHAIYTGLLCFLLTLWPDGYSAAAQKEKGVVQSIADDGTLLLDSGKQLRIADIIFPDGKTKSQQKLVGKRLSYETLATDRHGRITAYLYDEAGKRLSDWPGAMAYSDVSHAHTQEALAHDDATAFRVPHEETHKHLHRWRAVEGTVHAVTVLRDKAFINFGDDWKQDFSIYIPPRTLRRLPPELLPSLQDKTVMVRGYIHPYYGPRITLLNPDMLHLYASEPDRP